MMKLPLFPLSTVLFPGGVLPLHIHEDRYKALVKHCLSERQPFGVVLIKEGRETSSSATPYSIGSLARITQVEELEDGRYNIICRGEDRFRITALDRRSAEYLMADMELFPDEQAPEPALAMVSQRVAMLFNEYYRIVVGIMGGWQRQVGPEERIWMLDAGMLNEKQKLLQDEREEDRTPTMRVPALPDEPAILANVVASELSVHAAVKQELLETPSALARLQREAELLAEETAALEERLKVQIRSRFTDFGAAN